MPAFDRPVGLADMLRGVPPGAFGRAMEAALGPAWRLAGLDGAALREGPQPLAGEVAEAALEVDIEPVGTLAAPAACGARLGAAARWIELLLGASNRYRMAADLHLETVQSSHRELSERHARLEESEARYRALSAQLEARVQAQVALIEQGQRRLFQAERMASVGNLAAGMAHEINNPIGFIRSNLGSAAAYLGTLATALAGPARADPQLSWVLEDFASLLAESSAGADRVARIVADLKAYAGSGAGAAPLEMADPNAALRGALAQLGAVAAGVRIEHALAPAAPLVCDSAGLERVALALLKNACGAMRGRSGAVRLSSAGAAREWQFSVSDDGAGIDEATQARMFDPFFTTADVGGGMGLGLTLAADIVRFHRGRIDVRSAPGEGSTFTVRIPRGAGGPA